MVTVNIADTNRIWDFPFNGMVRLQGGQFVSEGRVEVYCNDQWGTICDSRFLPFGIDYYNTICHQLGYNDVRIVSSNTSTSMLVRLAIDGPPHTCIIFYSYNHFLLIVHFSDTFINSANTSQPIWHSNLNCDSNDDCITDCQLCPSTISSSISSSCNHSQDIYIACGKCNDYI